MKMKGIHIGLLALSMLAGCAATAPQCGGGAHAAVMDLLYFGTGRPHGPDVTAQEWTDFVHDEIAPRFPQGFSLLEAQGQWRNADGSVAHEHTHVLQLVHPDDAASARAVREIAERYKTRFDQEAVLQVGSAACMSL
ncbi:MAG TPA: DUF3574 domain-containing protein [Nevskia sp.]|jgi:hypothetical protein|nr:DUF3574 domain-containing protein [Nevskia sp.]